MRQVAAFVVVLAALCLASNAVPTPPIWPLVWSAAFNETAMTIGSAGTTTGYQYYDYTQRQERVDRANGRHDLICGTELPGVDTPCTRITVDGAMWIIYENQQKCCQCCTDKGGCGVLKNTWLADATFNGTDTINGIAVDAWYKEVSNMYYYDTTVGHFPIMIAVPATDYVQYDPTTFSTAALNSTLFTLPSYCTSKCTVSEACTSIN